MTQRPRITPEWRAVWLRTLLISYLVTSLVLTCLVIAVDHHGTERNPAHRHPAASGEPALEHTHGFEVLHPHASSSAHSHHGLDEGLAADPLPAFSTASGSPSAAFVGPAVLAAPGTAILASIGVPPLTRVAPVALIAWALVLLGRVGTHQALFAPPMHPPSPFGR
jgi:hypothetical protein